MHGPDPDSSPESPTPGEGLCPCIRCFEVGAPCLEGANLGAPSDGAAAPSELEIIFKAGDVKVRTLEDMRLDGVQVHGTHLDPITPRTGSRVHVR